MMDCHAVVLSGVRCEVAGDNVSGRALVTSRQTFYLFTMREGGRERITWSQEERWSHYWDDKSWEYFITKTGLMILSSRSPSVYFEILAMSCVSFNLSKYFSIIKHHHIFRENIIINVWLIFSCQPAVRVSGWRKSTEDLRQLSLIYTFLLGLCLPPITAELWSSHSLGRPVTDGRTADLLTWHWGC